MRTFSIERLTFGQILAATLVALATSWAIGYGQGIDSKAVASVTTQGIAIVGAADGSVHAEGPCPMVSGQLELDSSVVTLRIDCAAIFKDGFEQ